MVGASVPPVTTVVAVVEVTLVEVAGAVVETGTLLVTRLARVGAGGTVNAGLVSPAALVLSAGCVEATSETVVITGALVTVSVVPASQPENIKIALIPKTVMRRNIGRSVIAFSLENKIIICN